MNTTTKLMLSRNFVEFGPFSSDELSAFAARGIILETDYIKDTASFTWTPLAEWLTALSQPKPMKAPAKKRPVKQKAA